LHCAELQGFEFFFVFVKRTVRVDLNLDSALGGGFGLFFKFFSGLALGRIFRYHMTEFDNDRRLCPRIATHYKQLA
jgi:hypothetical protein